MKIVSLFAAAMIWSLSPFWSVAQSTNFLAIALLSNNTARITIPLGPGGVYALQGARTIGPGAEWTTLGSGFADGSGNVDFLDYSFTNCHARFYRACTGFSLFPATGMVTGREDEIFAFTLDGFGPGASNATLTATITRLPAHGQLFQYDGTPITAAPTVLTDTARRAKFLAETNRNGSPYTTFRYSVAGNGSAVSPEGSVEVMVTPVPDPPVCQFPGNSTCIPGQMNRVQTQENTSVIFALGVIDPDLENEGDVITVYARPLAPTYRPLGKLYQVQSDGRSQGPEITNETLVTNPQWLLMYVPTPDLYGCPLTTFDYWAQDSYGLKSQPAQVLLDVARVDDPPVAQPSDHYFTSDILEWGLELQGHDIDDAPADMALRFLTLPALGTIVAVPGGPVQTNQTYNLTVTLVYQLPVPADCNAPIPTGAPLTSFTWSLTDPSNLTAVATDTISILPGNQPPVAIGPARVGTVEHDTNGVAFSLGGTDLDGDDVIAVILSLPQHGQLKWAQGAITNLPFDLPPMPSGGSSFPITYVPDADFASDRPDFGTGLSQPDSFLWTVKDNPRTHASLQSRCQLTMLLDVTNVNDPPIITGPSSGTAQLTPTGAVSAVFSNIMVSDPDDWLHTGRETVHARITSTLADHLFLRNVTYGPFPGNNTPTIEFDTTPGQLTKIFKDGLEYVPATAGTGSITITVNDLGFAGLGGPQTGTNIITVQVMSGF